MNRRQAVQRVALLLGGTVAGAELFLQTGCKTGTKEKTAEEVVKSFFSPDQVNFLDEVAETIIPRTNTPGAKDAKVGEFMNVMVRDCYTPDDQQTFKEGIEKIDKLSKEKYNKGFMEIQPAQRTELLTALDKEQREYEDARKKKEALAREQVKKNTQTAANTQPKQEEKKDPKHYFRMMRELTLLGFFTSEPGATKVLRYAAVPGKYEPCIPYKQGDKAWAT